MLVTPDSARCCHAFTNPLNSARTPLVQARFWGNLFGQRFLEAMGQPTASRLSKGAVQKEAVWQRVASYIFKLHIF